MRAERLQFVRRAREATNEALLTISGHRLRSALAVAALAAAVGTSTLVSAALAAVERSAREASVRAFGADSYIIAQIEAGNLGRRELAEKLERNPPIRAADLRFLRSHAAEAVIYAPSAQTRADVTHAGLRFESAAVNGTSSELEAIRDVGIGRGRFFTATESLRSAQVAVIGADIAATLFPAVDPLGQRIRLGGRGFDVIGVLARQGSGGGTPIDRYVWIPYGTFARTFGPPRSLQVFAAAPPGGVPEIATDRGRTTMRARRQLAPGEEDNFAIISPDAARGFVNRITERIGAAGPPISGMAILAAIVVVTNTILVSVAQRTREIGIRRAVGASRADIVAEVLAESIVISLLGGVLGLVGASGLLQVLGAVLGMDLAVQISGAVGAFLAALIAGLAAGWLPARRAARIEVTGALHQE